MFANSSVVDSAEGGLHVTQGEEDRGAGVNGALARSDGYSPQLELVRRIDWKETQKGGGSNDQGEAPFYTLSPGARQMRWLGDAKPGGGEAVSVAQRRHAGSGNSHVPCL